jgi:hypothetical protein
MTTDEQTLEREATELEEKAEQRRDEVETIRARRIATAQAKGAAPTTEPSSRPTPTRIVAWNLPRSRGEPRTGCERPSLAATSRPTSRPSSSPERLAGGRRSTPEANAADQRTGGSGSRFQEVPFRNPRLLETLVEMAEQVAQAEVEEEVYKVTAANRQRYIEGESVEVPMASVAGIAFVEEAEDGA